MWPEVGSRWSNEISEFLVSSCLEVDNLLILTIIEERVPANFSVSRV